MNWTEADFRSEVDALGDKISESPDSTLNGLLGGYVRGVILVALAGSGRVPRPSRERDSIRAWMP